MKKFQGGIFAVDLSPLCAWIRYLYNAPGPRIERLVASSSSQPDHPSACSSSKGEYMLSFSGAEADVDDLHHHHSRSSSRSSLHALDLSNCPPTVRNSRRHL